MIYNMLTYVYVVATSTCRTKYERDNSINTTHENISFFLINVPLSCNAIMAATTTTNTTRINATTTCRTM